MEDKKTGVITVRVTEETKAILQAKADEKKWKISFLANEILTEYANTERQGNKVIEVFTEEEIERMLRWAEYEGHISEEAVNILMWNIVHLHDDEKSRG